MSDFMETAVAVEPVIRMLEEGGCGFVSANLFDDGSGSIVVETEHFDKAQHLLQVHGLTLDGHRDIDNARDYHFSIVLNELKKYVGKPCPHCGKDVAGL